MKAEIRVVQGAGGIQVHHFEFAKLMAEQASRFPQLTRNAGLTLEALARGRLAGGLLASLQNKVFFIDTVWVSPEFQRQGIGSDLIREAMNAARRAGCTKAVTTTYSFYDNAPFWRRHEFQEFAALEGVYPGARLIYFQRELRP